MYYRTLLFPKLLLFYMLLFQNIQKKDISKFSSLQSLDIKHFFTSEIIKLSNTLTENMLIEQLTLYALSTLKFKNQKSFFKFLLLLSGDIELNPGPTNFPCIVCEKGVRSKGVFCTQCGLWVHPKCDKISEAEYKILKKLSLTKHFKYTCKTCENKNDNINTSLLNSLDDSVSEETPDFVLTEEKWLHFKNRGLHFLHININSLLCKIDELRQIAKKSNATIIGITESKLDKSVTDEEVKIEGYKILRDGCVLH